jgi:ferrochelatase
VGPAVRRYIPRPLAAPDPPRDLSPPSPDRAPRGVLLVNLGSPSEPTPRAVRAFLSEFLGDPLVVDLNPLLWWAIRNLIVLPFRSPKVARAYQSIWMEGGSPLLVYGRRRASARAGELGPGWRVALAMRYGAPSIADGLAELAAAGCEDVLLVPLFPQYSHTTTGTIVKAAEQAVRSMPRAPRLQVLTSYEAHPAFVAAVAETLRESLSAGPVDHVVFSLHGLPVRYVRQGDPYQAHCEATVAALAAQLGLEPERWSLVYQSRFGREEWLGPAADVFVPALAPRAPRVLIAMPGFAADCLETLEEIGERLRDAFLEAGGKELRVAPCLNAHPAWIRGLAAIVREHADAP